VLLCATLCNLNCITELHREIQSCIEIFSKNENDFLPSMKDAEIYLDFNVYLFDFKLIKFYPFRV